MTDYSGDIAIVGMAGIYPDAEDIDAFWANILAKHDAVTEAPASWLGASDLLDPGSEDLMKIYTNRGGFLGDLSRFNPAEFSTMPRSVEGGQPDQFIALQVCRDALVDSGYTPGQHDHHKTGVILGHAVHAHRANANGVQQAWFHSQLRQYLGHLFPDIDPAKLKAATDMLDAKLPQITPESVPGLVPNIMTGRVANRLDLMGPNYIIDAACSSSLIAVELAAGELRAGNADMMLAGGINTTTSPLVYSVFCSVNALSQTGHIRPFGSEANGTVLGEGAGAVVLKRLEDALRDEDRIYAVVKAVGQSSDGKSSGLMAPRLEGEVLAMRRAYEIAGIDPATIGLVEAHGTGIPLGDRTEIASMREIFGVRQGALPTVPLGSVKSLIGHCIPAAGSAALIKSALSLTHKILPPTLVHEVNDGLGLEDTPFYISTETRPWIKSSATPRRAAINAFGFGGINAHIIIEESPVGRYDDATTAFLPRRPDAAPVEHVLVAVAATPAGMAEAVAGLRSAAEAAGEAGFADLARQSWDGAADHHCRLAVVATGPADLAKKLNAADKHLTKAPDTSLQTRNGVYYEPSSLDGKTAFLFPGEMAQYPDMMADVVTALPPARAWFDLLTPLFEGTRDTALHDVIFPVPSGIDDKGKQLLDRLMHSVDYGSEMVFAADQAVLTLLTSLGIHADGMLGHSTGENAAIVGSGWFGMERAEIGETIARMNVVFNEVNESGTIPTGRLLTIAGLDRDAVMSAYERHEGLHFTMDNCPNQAIVFGPEDTVGKLQSELVELGAVCTELPISWGYHTEYVAPMAEGFGKLFNGFEMEPTPVEIWSCATAQPFPKDREQFQKVAMAQYTSRVAFREAILNMHAAGYTRFVECGPNATLTAFVRDTLSDERIVAIPADNRRRGMLSQLRHLVAQLFTSGLDVTFPALLDHWVGPDEAHRQKTRDKHRRAPALPSNLPFPELDDSDAQTLRDLVGAGVARPAAPAEAPRPPLQPAEQPAMMAPPIAAPAPSRDAALYGHFDLMTEFLAGQERITRNALGLGTPAPRQIQVLDLTEQFPLPFSWRGVLMTGAPSMQAMQRHLSPSEAAQAAALADKSDDYRLHWSLGRLAVKRAARSFLSQMDMQLSDADLCIASAEDGAPRVTIPAKGLELTGASITHSGGSAVGAVAAPPWHIGVDFDLPERIRNPRELAAAILSDAEAARLPGDPTQDSVMLWWGIKEAASKALGMGIQGRPQAFEIVEFDPSSWQAKVANGGRSVDTCSRRLGRGICSVGWAGAA